ncbi:hypothetical protein GCM10023208_25370 [Erythrobacter westpacificensis]|uniref:GIY-YIG domain-containing protein n=1 Tax=Erythrobacter westpacificensis TaxID=1055231 RepID=A0ABP9KH23_9SPHN
MKQQFSRSQLETDGFVGWMTFDYLSAADPCPTSGGVYVVIRTDQNPPCFLDQSCGGWFKDRDPTVPHGTLVANWVEDAEVVYIGKANNLRRRLSEFAKFGAGKKIGHWGGRLIWQLGESSTLLVGWKETSGLEPALVEAKMIADFRAAYGHPPFANDPHRMGA